MDAPEAHPLQRDRPRSLHVQVSRLMAANYRSRETGSRADLATALEQCQRSDLFFGTDFPNYPRDLPTICDKMVQHAIGRDDVGEAPNAALQQHQDPFKGMRRDLLWTEAKDVWYLCLDPVWADFHGTPSTDNRPVPLIDACPINLWLYKEPDEDEKRREPINKAVGVQNAASKSKQQAKLHILGMTGGLVSAQVNHYQLLFLLRTVETISEITTFLSEDVRHILGEDHNKDGGESIAIGLVAPQVDVSLLMPNSDAADAVSTVGDSSSIAPAASEAGSAAGDLAALANSSTNISSTLANLTMANASPLSSSENQLSAGNINNSSEPASPQRAAPPSPSASASQLAASLPPTASSASLASRPSVPSISLQESPSQSSTSLASATSTPSKPRNLPAEAQAKKNSITASLSNMMASLDTSMKVQVVV